MNRFAVSVAAGILAAAVAVPGAAQPAPVKEAFDAIRADAIRAHTTFLSSDLLEVGRIIPEHHAAIALRVLVTALIRLSGIPQHDGTGDHHAGPDCGPILKAAGEDQGDGVAPVPLLERAVLRTGRADHVPDGPAIPGCDGRWRRAPRAAAQAAQRQCLL